jgi:hypothetical protein
MSKKNVLIIALAFSVNILFIQGNALAWPGFIDLFTTDSFGSTTPKSIFGPDETPYLYMNLEIPDGAVASTVSFWNDPDSLAYFGGNSVSTDTQRWSALSNWEDAKKTGTWTINANYFDSFGNNDVASTDFKVVPEPATMSLLLMGGLPMLLRRKQGLS